MIYKNITKKILNGLVYIKGKFLKVTNKDFFNILKLLKESLMQKLDKKIDFKNIEKIKYLKWCYDKILLDTTNNIISNLKPCSICWVDFGQNIGSELRKLRPAILWRSSSDKKIAHLSKDDYNNILLALKKYYTFENLKFLKILTLVRK